MTAFVSSVRSAVARIVHGLYIAVAVSVGLAVGLWLHLINGLRPVQVQRILADRIGHLAIEPELLLAKRELNPRPAKVYFFADEPPANSVMLRMWLREVPRGPSWALSAMFLAGQRIPRLRWIPDDWDVEHVDLRPLDTTAPHVNFTAQEEALGQRVLSELGVPQGARYVCLAVRDSAYLDLSQPGRDWSYHRYRDSEIETYVEMAEWLASQDVYVLRMGRQVASPLVSPDPRVIDYANSALRSDLADVYLFAHCDFCISTSTGMDALSALFRRPLGLVNLGSAGGLQLGGHVRLVMFKDLVDAATGVALPLDDERRLAAIWAGNTRIFDDLGLRLRDNSPGELAAFAKEMLALLDGSWTREPELDAPEARLKELTSGPYPWRLSGFHIASAWLARGEWIIRPGATTDAQ